MPPNSESGRWQWWQLHRCPPGSIWLAQGASSYGARTEKARAACQRALSGSGGQKEHHGTAGGTITPATSLLLLARACRQRPPPGAIIITHRRLGDVLGRGDDWRSHVEKLCVFSGRCRRGECRLVGWGNVGHARQEQGQEQWPGGRRLELLWVPPPRQRYFTAAAWPMLPACPSRSALDVSCAAIRLGGRVSVHTYAVSASDGGCKQLSSDLHGASTWQPCWRGRAMGAGPLPAA